MLRMWHSFYFKLLTAQDPGNIWTTDITCEHNRNKIAGAFVFNTVQWMAWQLWLTSDATLQRMLLSDGCMASRMEVYISVCVYNFGWLTTSTWLKKWWWGYMLSPQPQRPPLNCGQAGRQKIEFQWFFLNSISSCLCFLFLCCMWC